MSNKRALGFSAMWKDAAFCASKDHFTRTAYEGARS